MSLKLEHYQSLGVSLVVLLVSWSPLLVIRIRICILFLKFLLRLSCMVYLSLILQVNFVLCGSWLPVTMSCTLMEFDLKFQQFRHLLGGDCGAAFNWQHLHQGGWARESTSLDNHPLLLYPWLMTDWKLSFFTIYLQWLGIGISFCVWCVSYLVNLLLLVVMDEFQVIWVCNLIVLLWCLLCNLMFSVQVLVELVMLCLSVLLVYVL